MTPTRRALLALCLASAPAVADGPPEPPRKRAPDAAFVPTPHDVVARMLDLAKVTKADVVYDLGSGDGRVVVAAAKGYGCKAVGVEIDDALVAASRRRAREAGVEKLATFEHGDVFEADFTTATVVALYVTPAMSRKLVPKLDRLKARSAGPGCRSAPPIPSWSTASCSPRTPCARGSSRAPR